MLEVVAWSGPGASQIAQYVTVRVHAIMSRRECVESSRALAASPRFISRRFPSVFNRCFIRGSKYSWSSYALLHAS